VEADADRLHALVTAADRWPHTLAGHQGTLAAQAGAVLRWYCYSDGRLDGPLDVSVWKLHYPNVALLREQSMVGLCLADLLNDSPLAQTGDCGLHLWIRQGDPLQILEGAGEWLARVQRVELLAPKAPLIWSDAADVWLSQRGFKRQEGLPLVWERDVVATQRLELLALSHERDQLAAQLCQSEQKLSQLSGEIDELLKFLDTSSS
jgi:hypothetical protein